MRVLAILLLISAGLYCIGFGLNWKLTLGITAAGMGFMFALVFWPDIVTALKKLMFWRRTTPR